MAVAVPTRSDRAGYRGEPPPAARTSPCRPLPSEDRPRSDCLVMLGVTGDLAKKKLIPAVYRLHARGLLNIPVVGSGPAGLEPRRPGQPRPRLARGHRREVRQPDPRRPARALDLRVGRLRGPADLRAARAGRGRRRAPDLPHGHPAVDVRVRRRRPGRGRAQQGRPAHRREAVRARPRLGRRAERHDPAALPRVGDLPHRPLPRQGGHAQPAHHPLRQRHPRAAVAPHVRVRGEDHDGRVVRRRGPRLVLRLGRRPARRHAEPPAADGGAVRHGAAGQRERQGPPRREGQGADGGPAGRPEALRPGPVPRLPVGHRRGARVATPRPSARSGSTSIRPGGAASRSSSGPASRWPRPSPR